MSRLSPILRLAVGNRIHFWCPGCKAVHGINFGEGEGPRWTWNGDVNKPTFMPSLLVTSGHYIPGNIDGCWCKYNAEHPEDKSFKCVRCHSFIKDGRIQFLSDSTHELAGQTVDIPVYPG